MRHQWTVRAFLLARLARKDEAEDLAQDTFVTAWRRLADFDLERPFDPWLRGIAENLLRNHLRKFRAEPIGGDKDLQALVDAEWSKDAQAGTDSRRAVALEECLSRIDGPSRSMLVARYGEGHTVAEICRKLGRKHSAVTMQLHRLRLLLAKCVDGLLASESGAPNAS